MLYSARAVYIKLTCVRARKLLRVTQQEPPKGRKRVGSALPGKSSPNTAVALTKVALRLFKLGELADAISGLTGLKQTTVESLVRSAELELANRPSAEFSAVAVADRKWVENMLARTYGGLAAHSAHRVMSESLVGAAAVVLLADEAMTDADRRDVDATSDDVRAYLTAVSWAIATLISEWYATNEEPNRAAMSRAAGETLQTVRALPDALKAHLDSSIALVLARLEQPALENASSPPEPEPERILFELDFNFAPLATDTELVELVSAAVVAVLTDKPVRIDVSLPTLDSDVAKFRDAVLRAQIKRERQNAALRLRLVLLAFFSIQVEEAWPSFLRGVPDRVTVVRAILAGKGATGSKLDVWRTTPPLAWAPIWLTPDEVQAVVNSVGLSHWDHLRGGAGWRAVDELPHSLIVEKVMSSILAELVRQNVTNEADWSADALFLPSWHIGQG
jgi:hypothetical protein